jgi:hypothetical protein
MTPYKWGIIFSFIDGRSETFDLTMTMKYKKFSKLYRKLIDEGRKLFVKKTEPEKLTEFEMARVVSKAIIEKTSWENNLVLQVIESLSLHEKSLLFANIKLLPKCILKTEESKKAHDSISLRDVSLAIQTVIDNLEEQRG